MEFGLDTFSNQPKLSHHQAREIGYYQPRLASPIASSPEKESRVARNLSAINWISLHTEAMSMLD
jgi:hypothetical protein